MENLGSSRQIDPLSDVSPLLGSIPQKKQAADQVSVIASSQLLARKEGSKEKVSEQHHIRQLSEADLAIRPSVRKTSRIAVSELEKIGSGKAKDFMVSESHKGVGFLIPKRTRLEEAFSSRESEMRQEYAFMQKVKEGAKNKGLSTKHLDIQGEKIQIQGAPFAIQVKQARGDLGSMLSKLQSVGNRVVLGSQFLDGLSTLHKLGFAHGDLKPDNCLIFEEHGNFVLKISDFGKSGPIGSRRTETGNTRFNSDGECYAAAMMLIRILEEQYLSKERDSLVEVSKPKEHAAKGLRGIEKYVVEHSAFVARHNPGGSIKARFHKFRRTAGDRSRQQEAMHNYISILMKNMQNSGLTDHQLGKLGALLMRMTDQNPAKRPSVPQSAKEYHQIFSI